MHKIMAFILLCKSVFFCVHERRVRARAELSWDELKRAWVWIIECRLVGWCREGTGLLGKGIRKLHCLKYYSLSKVYNCMAGVTFCTWRRYVLQLALWRHLGYSQEWQTYLQDISSFYRLTNTLVWAIKCLCIKLVGHVYLPVMSSCWGPCKLW